MKHRTHPDTTRYWSRRDLLRATVAAGVPAWRRR